MSYVTKRQVVAQLVRECGMPVDRLAYTKPFEDGICPRYREETGDSQADYRCVLDMALDARKRKLVGRLVRGRKA